MINPSWDSFLQDEFNQPYFKQLSGFLHQEYQNATVYPPKKEVFSQFYYTDMDKVKAVIIGQDPYHEPGQACGLCFAVKPGVALPPSLKNIYQEIEAEYGCHMTNNGYLVSWARQGVLLLNAVLTVRQGQANSHANRGWETFTDHVIGKLNSLDQPIVFLLWGRYAQNKAALLDNPNHLVLKAAHPSPLSAYNGFFGCGHFKKADEYLSQHNLTPVDWRM